MLTVVDPESGYGVASSFFKMQKRIEKERKKEREERERRERGRKKESKSILLEVRVALL